LSAEPIPRETSASDLKANPDTRTWLQRRLVYVPLSLALLLPCYWQPRIQAGDLSSHIYNAWLTELIQSGRTEGLAIVGQATNVLFDLILYTLFRWLGPDWAQRLAVSGAVLIFIWGSFAFVCAIAGRRNWYALPVLAMLGYGWVFHMGFFNFYMALGLCFWAMSLVWKSGPLRLAGAAALFAVAYAAHALPVVWSLALVGYLWIARLCPEHFRPRLLTAGILLLIGAHFLVMRVLTSLWSPSQLTLATGGDQLWVFDGKYYYLLGALLLFWGALLLDLLETHGGRRVAASIPLHWCVLTAAGIVVLPSTVLIPGFLHSLVYISERMSLAAGVCACAVLAAAPARGFHKYAVSALALVFFVFLFRDERKLNEFEDRVDRAVAQVPAGQRVVSPIVGFDLRADALVHMLDRACLGRCFSYADYEPSTAQFRVRVIKPNPFVVFRYGDSWDLQNGRYVIQQADLPLLALGIKDNGEVTVRSLKAGAATGTSEWLALQNRKVPDR